MRILHLLSGCVAPLRHAGILIFLLTVLCAFLGSAQDSHAQEPNKAALIVVHGDGRVVTQCVAFSEPQLTGYDLLRRSGLDLNTEASGMGATVCRLDNEGCSFPEQSCFCQCEGENCRYWSYWQWDGATWQYSTQGASNRTVLPGAVQGWVWGTGASGLAPSPPVASFATICAPPTPTGTPTGTPTATSIATPLPTPIATSTPAGVAQVATATVEPVTTPTSSPSATATATFGVLPTWTPLPATAPAPTPSPVLVATPAPLPVEQAGPVAVATLPVLPTPVIVFFIADHTSIEAGAGVQLSWRVHGAEHLHLEAAGIAVPVELEGALLIAPQQNTTYVLVAAAAGGINRAGLTVAVRPKPAEMASPAPVLPTAPVEVVVAEQPAAPPTAAAPATAAALLLAVSMPTPAASATLPAVAAAIRLPATATLTAATQSQPGAGMPAPLDPLAAGRNNLIFIVVGFVALAGLPLGLAAVGMVIFLMRR